MRRALVRRARDRPELEVGDLVNLTSTGHRYVVPSRLKGRKGLCGVVIETPTDGNYLVMVDGECHWFYPTDLEKI
jgi:hypothetical protein